MEDEITFNVSSIYGAHTEEGIVCIELGIKSQGAVRVQLSAADAISMASSLIQASCSAQIDEALMHALKKVGFPLEGAAQFLNIVREERARRTS